MYQNVKSAALPERLAKAGEIRLRPATPADALIAAQLIYLPMGRMADFLFGFNDPQKAREILAQLFVCECNRFSYQFADVAENGCDPAGLLLGYPWEEVKSFHLPMAKRLFHLYGWAGMIRFLHNSVPLLNVVEAQAGEFYIFTIAVFPKFQGSGIGRQLLERAEQKAKSAGCAKCSLGVELDNYRAIEFYKRQGYRRDGVIRIPRLERRIGYKGVFRMVKDVR